MIISHKKYGWGWRQWVTLEKEQQDLYIVKYRNNDESSFQRFLSLEEARKFYDKIENDLQVKQ